MPPAKLPPHLSSAVLAALGLLSTTACDGGSDDTGTGPCLDVPADSASSADSGDGGDDTGTGPCLDVPADTGDTNGAPQEASAPRPVGALPGGVLPADVARLLETRRETPK